MKLLRWNKTQPAKIASRSRFVFQSLILRTSSMWNWRSNMAENDSIGSAPKGFEAGWNWKNAYVGGLGGKDGTEYGMEKFGHASASPDTTAVFAGPCRFTGITGPADLTAIGMVDGISFSSQAQLAQLFEI